MKVTPNLEETLTNSLPTLAGFLLARPEWKAFWLTEHPEAAISLLVFIPLLPVMLALLKFAWPRLFPDTANLFLSLDVFRAGRGPDFTALPFVGREAELRALDELAGQPEQGFRWRVLTGEPGAGKTRLAVEWAGLLLRQRRGWVLPRWDVLVLRAGAKADALQSWRPRRATLVLVDEFATRREDLAQLAQGLLQREPPLRKPVRVLLVDWGCPEWLNAQSAEHGLPVGLRAGESLLCPEWDRAAFGAALPLLWPKDRPPCDAAMVDELFEASEGNALALGYLLQNPEAAREPGGRRKVFRDWAAAVRLRLEKELPEDHLPLVVLAAWCGGFPKVDLDEARRVLDGPKRYDLARLRLISPRAVEGAMVPRLEPETLALEFALAEMCRVGGEAFPAALRDLGWYGNPAGTARSLWRLHRLALHGLLTEEERGVLALLDGKPVLVDAVRGKAVVKAWKELQEVLAAERKAWAEGLCYAINDQGGRGELVEMASSYNRLRDFALIYRDDPAVRAVWACGIAFTVLHFGLPNDWANMDTRLEELRALSKAHPNEIKICLCLVSALGNAIQFYSSLDSQSVFLVPALDELRALVIKYSDEVNFRWIFARGLRNTADFYRRLGNRESEAAILNELRIFGSLRPGDVRSHLELAKSLFNAANHYGRLGDLAAQTSAIVGLRTMCAMYPNEAELRLELAMALCDMSVVCGWGNNWSTLSAVLNELRSLYLAHTNEVEIPLILAKGIFGAASDSGKIGNLSAMERYLDELVDLAAINPEVIGIQIWTAKGLHNVAVLHPSRATWAIAQLKELARRFPIHEEIQELAHQHGVSYAAQEIARHRELERQAQALINARR